MKLRLRAHPRFRVDAQSCLLAQSGVLSIGPSAVSTIGLRRWQNISDYRLYADRVLAGESAWTGDEVLTPAMKRAEAIALSLRTNQALGQSGWKST